jgi:MYXO-CTERM domain-containing protein
VECPAGKVCAAGECVDSCTGIACPHGLACRNGGCVDPCMGIECDDGFACVDGICTSCECSACASGTMCSDSKEHTGVKLCLDTGCESQTCTDHTHCSMGQCVDDCDGATCPMGQVCAKGACIADGTTPGGGGSDNGTGGLGPLGGIGPLGGSFNPSAGKGANGTVIGSPVTTDQKACNCTVPGGKSSSAGALVLLALFGIGRRRRQTARRGA